MNINNLIKLLQKTPQEIFGSEKDVIYRKLALQCHPDSGGTTELFQLLNAKYEALNAPKTVITSKKQTYEIDGHFVSGDVTDFFRSSSRLLKVARLPITLSTERDTLKAIFDDTKYQKLHAYYSPTIDSFSLPDGRNVNVFEYDDNFVSLEKVAESYPNGIDFRNLAWIMKRIATALALLHECGRMHGAVLPSHVLVNPKTHGAKIVGLNHGCKIGDSVKTISSKYKSMYASEILEKKTPDASTDLYMLGQTMLWLLKDTNDEPKLRIFLEGLLVSQKKRIDSVWAAYTYWDELLKKVFGDPKWVELIIK